MTQIVDSHVHVLSDDPEVYPPKPGKVGGAWITEAGQPNEVSHLWAYPSVDARTELRGRVAADPRWKEFLGKAGPLLEEMHSTILLPAAHSPLG